MNTEKMRKEFEEWYLAEYYESDKQCGLEWLSTESCGGYRYADPAREWKAWQASRGVLVIELPRGDSLARRMFGPQATGANPLISRFDAIEAIEAAGLRVKP
ncbi:hypothetical protein [Pseudomonas viridiflava]|uniref:hypothetical protein n=1 Tax=Pseudomonas viridiflava TaxID=33069 RepID=UPI000F045B43|nr:hypothetical protein [Pseudomonas viridiflava]